MWKSTQLVTLMILGLCQAYPRLLREILARDACSLQVFIGESGSPLSQEQTEIIKAASGYSVITTNLDKVFLDHARCVLGLITAQDLIKRQAIVKGKRYCYKIL